MRSRCWASPDASSSRVAASTRLTQSAGSLKAPNVTGDQLETVAQGSACDVNVQIVHACSSYLEVRSDFPNTFATAAS